MLVDKYRPDVCSVIYVDENENNIDSYERKMDWLTKNKW